MRPRLILAALTTAALLVPAVAAADTSTDPPIADPIPAPITMSGLEARIEHVVTIPPTGSGPDTRINGATHAGDGSNRLFVPDMRGDVFVVDAGPPSAYLDVAAAHPDFTSDQGLSSGLSWVTFDPDFATNGRLYTAHTEDGAALAITPDFPHQLGHTIHGVVTEWTATDPAANTFNGTHRELMRVGFVSNFHGLQQIEFGPDGFLYIGIGDGDSTTFSTGAQSLDRAQGKLLRIDPDGSDSANGAYGIPAGNPFATTAGALDEIYAVGFRNPHRFSWDTGGGKLLLANIGQANIESVYEIVAGNNYGWNEREGSFLWDPAYPDNVYPLPAGDAAHGYTYPVAQYDHDEGYAVVGGFVHRSLSVPELYGEYLFGDISNGRIFAAEEVDLVNGAVPARIEELRLFDETDTEVTLLDLSPTSRVDLRFGMDEAGSVLITSKQTGDIHRITSRNPTPVPTILPGVTTVTETPGGVVASIPFSLSAPSAAPVSADMGTIVLSPEWYPADPEDYAPVSGTIEFAPFTTETTFDVYIHDDLLDEYDEVVPVAPSNPVNAVVGGTFGFGVAVILDNEPTPTVTPGVVVANPERDSGRNTWQLPITLSEPSGRRVSVNWEVIDIPENPAVAHPGIDLNHGSGSVSFEPGETIAHVPLRVIGDTEDEPPLLWGEWGLVSFRNPSNTSVTGGLFGHGLLIIIDDD